MDSRGIPSQGNPRGSGFYTEPRVLAAYPDGRYLTGQTDADGKCGLNLYRADQKMKLLVAAEGHLPFHTIPLFRGNQKSSPWS